MKREKEEDSKEKGNNVRRDNKQNVKTAARLIIKLSLHYASAFLRTKYGEPRSRESCDRCTAVSCGTPVTRRMYLKDCVPSGFLQYQYAGAQTTP